MTVRSVVHGSFTVIRSWPHSPDRVFHAFADAQAKAKWFAPGFERLEDRWDFREGGNEVVSGRHPSGMVSRFDCLYRDIVAPEGSEAGRIVYSYVMHLDGKKISVSQACIEVWPEGAGSRLVVTEHGDFLDGYDDKGSREHGTNWLIDTLGKSLDT
jgi:uncharacterized protein YndB with AHSA1/START domain